MIDPKQLPSNVRKQVIEATNCYFKKVKESPLKNEDELRTFFKPFYNKVKNDIGDNIETFLELCLLEYKYGMISGYMGGATLKSKGDTKINLN